MRCTQCRAEAKRVFVRRSKLQAKLRLANLQQESNMLENQLDHQEEISDEIWAEKLAYNQCIEELQQKREQLRQQMNNLKCNKDIADSSHLYQLSSFLP